MTHWRQRRKVRLNHVQHGFSWENPRRTLERFADSLRRYSLSCASAGDALRQFAQAVETTRRSAVEFHDQLDTFRKFMP